MVNYHFAKEIISGYTEDEVEEFLPEIEKKLGLIRNGINDINILYKDKRITKNIIWDYFCWRKQQE